MAKQTVFSYKLVADFDVLCLVCGIVEQVFPLYLLTFY